MESSELRLTERRKILRQHQDLRRLLAVILEATRDTELGESQRSPSPVGLGLRLQSMLERHAAFEEGVLAARVGAVDRARIDALIREHRRQRAELSLLTKISLGNTRLGTIRLAFRWLARNILTGMDVEERQLFGPQAGAASPRRWRGGGCGA
jgi:Hemerythrin HHE cation binding domain